MNTKRVNAVVKKNNIEQAKSFVKSRTWLYFFRNKILEILAIPAVIYLPYILGKLAVCTWGSECITNDFLFKTALWIVGVFITIFALIIIMSNWQWAEKQAKDKAEKKFNVRYDDDIGNI